MSQTLTVLSSEAEYSHLPVGCSARPLTQLSWPWKVWSRQPELPLCRLIDLSREQVRISS